MNAKYELKVMLGSEVENMYPPEIRDGVENVELPKPGPDMKMNAQEIPHTLELFEEDGIQKGIYTTPLGMQKLDKVYVTPYSISYEAYTGSEGVELFKLVLNASPDTYTVAGFMAGSAPFFRGYTFIQGRLVK